MASGLQIFAVDGTLLMDATSHVSRLLGVLTPPPGADSYNDPRIAEGEPWAMIRYESPEATGVLGRFVLVTADTVVFSGTDIVWFLADGPGREIIYGVN